jgi:thioredoxin-related protein
MSTVVGVVLVLVAFVLLLSARSGDAVTPQGTVSLSERPDSDGGVSTWQGVHLVMFDAPGCEFCEVWNEQIGGVYAKTPEGKFASLVRMDRLEAGTALPGIKPIIYTPTFVLIRDSEEVGRITGYMGEDFFWMLLGEILHKAGYQDQDKAS